MKNKTSIEASYYDKKVAAVYNESSGRKQISSTDKVIRNSHECYEKRIKELLDEKKEGHILDYGCGTAYRNMQFANHNWKITGIDVSSVSIEIANKIAVLENINASYQVMDCENMEFNDGIFDVIVDYGTFSSLDMQKALPQITRVLKSNGAMIAIETLGHNPITNLKRWISMLTGRRTKWATAHIMKIKDWKMICKQFSSSKIYYFGFFVIFLSPFVKYCPDIILRIFEGADKYFLRFPLFRRYAFKTVVVLKNPVTK